MVGLGLATAIFIDSTIVRMVLVPATMKLMGNANWWIPRWLDRILPNIEIDGESALPDPDLLPVPVSAQAPRPVAVG
jgi:RND superfamily putative drug exporter